MILLALETSTRRLSAALWLDGRIIERSEDVPNGGSERLLPWVGELLAEAGIGFPRLDGIAFGAGPGGFTGLRLACGIAQGLGFALDRPVIGVGSLEALALESGASKVYACVDARMNEVYVAAYRIEDGLPVEVLAPAVPPPKEAPLPPGEGWTGCGDGFFAYSEPLCARLGGRLWAICPDVFPTAAAVARLAAPRLAGGEGMDAGLAAPAYVRDKVALTTAERLAQGGIR